jgi:hypothetical protein
MNYTQRVLQLKITPNSALSDMRARKFMSQIYIKKQKDVLSVVFANCMNACDIDPKELPNFNKNF